jgi:hypothetical protein
MHLFLWLADLGLLGVVGKWWTELAKMKCSLEVGPVLRFE